MKAAQSDGRREKSQQLTSVVEANFQGLVAAERSVSQLSGAGSRTKQRGYKSPHQNSDFSADFMLRGGE